MKLEILATHAHYRTLLPKLTAVQKDRCQAFLDDHGPKPDFETILNRWFLDRPKPPNWTLMMELTSAARTLTRKTPVTTP